MRHCRFGSGADQLRGRQHAGAEHRQLGTRASPCAHPDTHADTHADPDARADPNAASGDHGGQIIVRRGVCGTVVNGVPARWPHAGH